MTFRNQILAEDKIGNEILVKFNIDTALLAHNSNNFKDK